MKFYKTINGERYLFVVGFTKSLNLWMAINGKEVKRAEAVDVGIACYYNIYDDYWLKKIGVRGQNYVTVFHWSAGRLERQIREKKTEIEFWKTRNFLKSLAKHRR